MNTSAQNKTPQHMVEAIFALDLEQIKAKLMHETEGYGWSREQADRCEIEYKRYLALLAKYPDETIVPSAQADKFWHGHILDTMKYAADCQAIFGYFLHHYPYFGLRGEQDAANQALAADTMRRLYEKEFGQAQAAGSAAYCGKSASPENPSAAYCGRANVSYCGKANDKVVAASKSAAYCGMASTSYCGKASDSVTTHADTAYCGVASTSYCGKATGPAAAAQPEDTAYCGVANVSYCGKASDKLVGKHEAAAYCGVATVAK